MFEKIRDLLELKNIPIEKLRTEKKKIPWDHFFLFEALLWAQRSHDPQTQCGCVIVNNKRVISSGYNGFLSKIDDTVLPNLRPYKYNFMLHAEINALLNCARNGVKTEGCTAYVTGEPCNQCLQFLWQAGITHIVYSDFSNINMVKDKSHSRIQSTLTCLMNGGINIEFIPKSIMNFSFIIQDFCDITSLENNNE